MNILQKLIFITPFLFINNTANAHNDSDECKNKEIEVIGTSPNKEFLNIKTINCNDFGEFYSKNNLRINKTDELFIEDVAFSYEILHNNMISYSFKSMSMNIETKGLFQYKENETHKIIELKHLKYTIKINHL